MPFSKSSETFERGFASLQANSGNHSDDQEIASDILCNEFIHDFNEVKEKFTKKLHELSDFDLKHEVPRGKFNVFKDFRRRLTKWYVNGHHLVKNLTTRSDTRKFLKLRISFSPAISNESTIYEVRSTLKTTGDRCETLLTANAIRSTFDLNKEALDLFNQATENSDTSLINILMKAYRSICRRYSYLSRPNNTPTYNDDINGRDRPPLPPPRRRTYYRRQPQRTDR